MSRHKTPPRITKSFSLTKKILHNLSSAKRLPGAAGADVAAADAAAADAAGEVAGAAAAAEEVAAGPGASVARVRPKALNRRSPKRIGAGSCLTRPICL